VSGKSGGKNTLRNEIFAQFGFAIFDPYPFFKIGQSQKLFPHVEFI